VDGTSIKQCTKMVCREAREGGGAAAALPSPHLSCICLNCFQQVWTHLQAVVSICSTPPLCVQAATPPP